MNQKGIANLVVVLVLIGGILVGLQLIKKTQIFKPKANGNGVFSISGRDVNCTEGKVCTGKNSKIKSIKFIHQKGVRPRFSPDGRQIVFDRKNPDGHFDVYLSDINGSNVKSLTEGKTGIGQKSNGNALYHPAGNHIVFISEEEEHVFDKYPGYGDSGIGLFSNLWATDPEGKNFWKMTNIPIRKKVLEGTPIYATVNPVFSPDGNKLFWTERYGNGGNHNWGVWRIKSADFVVSNGIPSLLNEKVEFTPQNGTYVTAMGFLDANNMIVAGNLDGQHEYGMDQYIVNLQTKELKNLTSTPEYWEEDSSLTNENKIIYMTNIYSQFKMDFNSSTWHTQPMERDYIIMEPDGSGKERLTYFNDPTAPEYIGKRVLSVAGDVSPDGRYMAATLGVDFGDDKRDVELKIALIEFAGPRLTEAIPAEHRQLYDQISEGLDKYEKFFNENKKSEDHQVIFGAELLPANGNRGEELLSDKALPGTILYMDRLVGMGVKGVTIKAKYPLLLSTYPNSQKYLAYYKEVIKEARKRGLKINMGAGPAFSNTSFSDIKLDYSKLAYEEYIAGEKEILNTVISELQPDYLNLASEPDTLAKLTGYKQINTPAGYVKYIKSLLEGLPRGKTLIGAGTGTWSPIFFVNSLATQTDLDIIVIHVYPIGKQHIQNVVYMSDIAAKNNKKVIINETWLYKWNGEEGFDIAANEQVFRKDVYGFWEPLDERFLRLIAKIAKQQNIEYMSPFWSTYFFASLPYDDTTKDASFSDLQNMLNKRAISNIVNNKLSPLGEAYSNLIRGLP